MSRRSTNDYQRDYPKVVRHMELALHRRMTAIPGNSKLVVKQLVEVEGVPDKACHLIYNGLEQTQRISNLNRQDLGLSQESVIFCIIANLIPYEGHQDL